LLLVRKRKEMGKTKKKRSRVSVSSDDDEEIGSDNINNASDQNQNSLYQVCTLDLILILREYFHSNPFTVSSSACLFLSLLQQR
jgi:hypothetical protein